MRAHVCSIRSPPAPDPQILDEPPDYWENVCSNKLALSSLSQTETESSAFFIWIKRASTGAIPLCIITLSNFKGLQSLFYPNSLTALFLLFSSLSEVLRVYRLTSPHITCSSCSPASTRYHFIFFFSLYMMSNLDFRVLYFVQLQLFLYPVWHSPLPSVLSSKQDLQVVDTAYPSLSCQASRIY